jgi:hypothetical protein
MFYCLYTRALPNHANTGIDEHENIHEGYLNRSIDEGRTQKEFGVVAKRNYGGHNYRQSTEFKIFHSNMNKLYLI